MSRSILSAFATAFKFVMTTDKSCEISKKEKALAKLTLILFPSAFAHSMYAYTTSNEKTLSIEKKYTMVRNGQTEFMVVDENGDHYNMNNSLWYFKWDSVEDWNRIPEGKKIPFRYYGYRLPMLGIFPNIYFVADLVP